MNARENSVSRERMRGFTLIELLVVIASSPFEFRPLKLIDAGQFRRAPGRSHYPA
jgi:hypothetical protein